MKFTLSWLKQHLDTTASLEQICDKLTAVGLEVEGVTDPGKSLAPFIIAHVLTAEKHPQADRLQVTTVDTGTEKLQVVCGAPNCRAGMKAVLARPGDLIPYSGEVLKKGVIRTVESQGMLCGADELLVPGEPGAAERSIIELPADAPVGKNFAEYAGYNDPVIEINVTPNRPDCTGVRGIARDLAATGIGKLKPLDTSSVAGKFKSPIKMVIDTDAKAACPLITGKHIRGIKNGPSPKWLQDKLRAIGLRPISVVVDITNYITYDLGRPLHAFDAKKLKGNLRVHAAKGGEKLTLLNGKDYTMLPGITVISDDSGALEVTAIMGGESTACDANTTDIYFISAYCNPAPIAKAGRALQLTSDARYRFERGIDPQFTVHGTEIATRLLLQILGTQPEVSELETAGTAPEDKRSFTLDSGKCKKLAGVDVDASEQEKILAALGFEVTRSTQSQSSSPPFKGGVSGGLSPLQSTATVDEKQSKLHQPPPSLPLKGEELCRSCFK